MFTGMVGTPTLVSEFDGFLLGVGDAIALADGTYVAAIIYSANIAVDYPDLGDLDTLHLQQFDATGALIGPRYMLEDDSRSAGAVLSVDQVALSLTSGGDVFAAWSIFDREDFWQVRYVETVLDGTQPPIFDRAWIGMGLGWVSGTSLTGGGAAVAFADPVHTSQGTQLYGVVAIDAAGNAITPEAVLEEIPSQFASFVIETVALEDGGFVAVWNQGFQVFEADGTPRTAFTPIPAVGSMPTNAFAEFVASDTVALSDGGFAIAGRYDDGQAFETGLFMVRFDAQGQVVTDAGAVTTIVNFDALSFQIALVVGGSGNPLLVWSEGFDGQGVHVAHSDAAGGLHAFGLVSLGFEDDVPFGGLISIVSAFQGADGEAELLLSFDDEFGVDRPADGYYLVTLAGAVIGSDSDDLLIDRAGPQRFIGLSGEDMADFQGAEGRVLVDLASDVSGLGFARFFTDGAGAGDIFAGVEHVTGGGFADNLRGDGGANLLVGGAQSDRLYGRSGDDTLDGGAGADALYGNLGADVLTGGADGLRDRFIFFSMAESTPDQRDTITDFTPGEDRIEISRFDADITQGFKQRFDWIGDAAFSGTAGELGYRVEGGTTIVQADVDGDAVADFEIALTGVLTLTEADFLI